MRVPSCICETGLSRTRGTCFVPPRDFCWKKNYLDSSNILNRSFVIIHLFICRCSFSRFTLAGFIPILRCLEWLYEYTNLCRTSIYFNVFLNSIDASKTCRTFWTVIQIVEVLFRHLTLIIGWQFCPHNKLIYSESSEIYYGGLFVVNVHSRSC